MIPGPAWLFCPADQPDRFTKAADRADAVILDLEDAVSPSDRPSARRSIEDIQLDPERTIIRVNATGTPDLSLDLVATARTAYRNVTLTKTESAAQVDHLGDAGHKVIALCETARGIEHATEIARHPAVIALMWEAEDLVVSMGGRSSRAEDGRYRDVARYARSRVLIAATAAGKSAVDAVHLDIADVRGQSEEARDAAAVGFFASACIHPGEVSAIRAAYKPTQQERERSLRLPEEARFHAGAFQFEGQMVDEPILRQARAALKNTALVPEAGE
jgi:citrate lyase subunit beta/citryl-CoA lyase